MLLLSHAMLISEDGGPLTKPSINSHISQRSSRQCSFSHDVIQGRVLVKAKNQGRLFTVISGPLFLRGHRLYTLSAAHCPTMRLASKSPPAEAALRPGVIFASLASTDVLRCNASRREARASCFNETPTSPEALRLAGHRGDWPISVRSLDKEQDSRPFIEIRRKRMMKHLPRRRQCWQE